MPKPGNESSLITCVAAALIISGALKSFFLGLIPFSIIRSPPWASDPVGINVNGSARLRRPGMDMVSAKWKEVA